MKVAERKKPNRKKNHRKKRKHGETKKKESSKSSSKKAPSNSPSKKKAATKKKKDPNAPKGAKSAYMYFCDKTRPELKANEPELTFGEVGKKLGSLWGALDEESKAPFLEKAASDKARFDEQMADYTPPKQESDNDDNDDDDSDNDDDDDAASGKKKKKVVKKKAKKDPNAPKRPMSSYFIWMGEVREAMKAQHPEASVGEFGKILGAKWKTLSEEEKAPYLEKAAINKGNYNEAMKRYKAGETGDGGDGGEKDTVVKDEEEEDDDDEEIVKGEKSDDNVKAEEEDDDNDGMSD
mmetsp:Transcript_42800/g.55005  ORF Transcript_42800/g.55005 Transcript_42800/m.55005 type:complete len:294 (+) Transcript_42800:787-1668(+)